jgi:hypothetical protein
VFPAQEQKSAKQEHRGKHSRHHRVIVVWAPKRIRSPNGERHADTKAQYSADSFEHLQLTFPPNRQHSLAAKPKYGKNFQIVFASCIESANHRIARMPVRVLIGLCQKERPSPQKHCGPTLERRAAETVSERGRSETRVADESYFAA